jgi:predicted amidophosphoribosyltransferase
MHNRHIPRLCRACTAPMAGQENTCWNCGAAYTSVDRTTPRPAAPPVAA